MHCFSLFLVATLAACTCDPARTPPSGALRAPSLPRAPAPAPRDAVDGGLLARKLPRIEYRGGPFLRNPKLVTITFTNDDKDMVARLTQFGSVITRTSWWHAVTEGYCSEPTVCIGDGNAAPPVHVDQKLPADVRDSDIEALLLRAAKAGQLGAIDDNTLLLVYLPQGVSLSDATTRYCTGHARAFHRSLEIDRRRVPYAVLPRCGDEAQLTATASHEILEATTNPFPAHRGFAFVTGSTPSGFSASGLEPVDPCGLTTMDGHWTTESGFVVQRTWSNRAAALALDPCVPARPEQPYAMLVPREPALRLAHVGDSVTIALDASTAGASRTWAISAFDLSGYQDHEQYVDLSLDKSTITAGESVTLTIKVLKGNPSQHEVVAIVSTLGVHSSMWPLLVMMR